jgi:tyrosine-protein kinase Etk/Wzc
MQSKQSKQQGQKDDNQVVQIMASYLSYWPLFVLSIPLCLGLAYLYIHYTVPKYQASATIIIKDSKKGYSDNNVTEDIDAIGTKKIIENETEVVQSRILMAKVVKKLRLYAPISREGKVQNLSAYTSSPIVVEARYPDKLKYTWDSTANIPLSYDATKKLATLNNKITAPLNEWVNTPYGELKFLENPNYSDPGEFKPLRLNFIPPKDLVPMILSNLSAEPSNKLSSVLDLSFKDEVPRRAEDILNTLLLFYNEASLEEKNTLVKNTLESIDSRLSIVAHDLDSIEQKMKQYKTSKNAIDLSQQGNLYLQGVNVSDNKLGEAQVQLSNLDNLENMVQSSNNAGILPSGLGINDPSLTQLMSNLNAAQINYEKLKKTVGENNPILQSYKEEISNLKPDILANIQTQKRNLSASIRNLNSTSGKYSSMLNYIPEKEKELIEISRDKSIKEGIYSFLLQKREETQLSYSYNTTDSKVVNYALANPSPVSPKKTLIYAAALIFGLVIPFLFINAKELLNNKILYRKEIETATSIPVIGEIVHNKSNASVVIEPGKRTFIAEEFRKIRVSLLYLGIDAYHKKILVTSIIPGEGKSFIASNLAISLAMTGKKVALVDMDLHDPSLGKLFNIPMEDPGVSDYLLGEKAVEDIIVKIPSYENLFFIPAGALHPTPSELLENGQVQNLVSALDNSFDAVILDGPPVVMVTDAYYLSSLADTTLYIIRHKYTPKLLVKRIDENNKINTLKNPAIIFNGVKNKGFVKNNYGYGYDYVYGGDKKNKRKPSKSLT